MRKKIVQIAMSELTREEMKEVEDSRMVMERMRSWIMVGRGRRTSGRGGSRKIEREEREKKTKVLSTG